jgi:hypothetical protein
MDWISVKDKLPEEDRNVILFSRNEVFCGNLYVVKNKVFWGIQGCDGICYGFYEKGEPTHWMPLPNPPDINSCQDEHDINLCQKEKNND